MKTLMTLCVAVALLGCASPPTVSECDRIVSVAADLSVLITELATDDEKKREAVERYAGLVKAGASLGCPLLPSEQDAPE